MGDVHAEPVSSLQQPRRHRSSVAPPANDVEAKEVQNARALQVLARVKEKLTGRDGKPGEEQKVNDQVSRLIVEATNLENLCQHYIGWCSFW
jgi:FKBP12-rapamycin complex-associated protein